MKSNVKLGVIGCGKMATAILTGVCNNNFINSDDIFVYDINEAASKNLAATFGFNFLNSIDDMLLKCDVLLLAVKPYTVDDVMKIIKKNYRNNLIMSILAGVKIEKYKSYIEDIKIVRIMPNTPALVNEAMSAVCVSDCVSDYDIDFAFNFMKNCGKVIKTTEDKIDIITALSGSGPAFYFKIIKDFANSACKLGLDFDEAMLLSAQTALGSAKMLIENNFDYSTLIKNVTTPGGCTEVGNKILDNSVIEDIIFDTIDKTTKKAIELG